MDKILIRIKNGKLEKRLYVNDVRYPGSFSIEHFSGEDWKLR